LTIGYIDGDDKYVDRKTELWTNYGFVCECAKCREEGKYRKKGRRRRK